MVTQGDIEHFSDLYREGENNNSPPVQLCNPFYWNYCFWQIIGAACQTVLAEPEGTSA
jgi:hypothetical protein